VANVYLKRAVKRMKTASNATGAIYPAASVSKIPVAYKMATVKRVKNAKPPLENACLLQENAAAMKNVQKERTATCF